MWGNVDLLFSLLLFYPVREENGEEHVGGFAFERLTAQVEHNLAGARATDSTNVLKGELHLEREREREEGTKKRNVEGTGRSGM